MCPFTRFVFLFPPSLQWVPWPPLSEALRFPTFTGTMGSYDRSALVRTPYGFPRLHVPSTLQRLSSRQEGNEELSWVSGQPL
jgi:hypothetical protein